MFVAQHLALENPGLAGVYAGVGGGGGAGKVTNVTHREPGTVCRAGAEAEQSAHQGGETLQFAAGNGHWIGETRCIYTKPGVKQDQKVNTGIRCLPMCRKQ